MFVQYRVQALWRSVFPDVANGYYSLNYYSFQDYDSKCLIKLNNWFIFLKHVIFISCQALIHLRKWTLHLCHFYWSGNQTHHFGIGINFLLNRLVLWRCSFCTCRNECSRRTSFITSVSLHKGHGQCRAVEMQNSDFFMELCGSCLRAIVPEALSSSEH